MLTSGIVKGFTIDKNRDDEKKTLLLQVELSSPDDVQTVEQINHGGEQYNPPNGSQVIVLNLGDAWKVAIASDDNIEPDLDPGEKEIYSTDPLGETKISHVKCSRDGVKQLVEINGDADFAVRFNELETAFNQLLADFNEFIEGPNPPATSGYNIHTHVAPAGGGTTGPPSPQGGTSAADISPAKVEDVKLTGATP